MALDHWNDETNSIILKFSHKKRSINWVYNILFWLKYAIIPRLKKVYEFDLFVIGIYQNYFKSVLFYKDVFNSNEINVPSHPSNARKICDFSSKLFVDSYYPFKVLINKIKLNKTTLIIGPPGSGKTTLIKSLECSWLNYITDGSENGLVFTMDICKMVTPYVGEGELYIRQLFNQTKYSNANALITIDGVELFVATNYLENIYPDMSEERTNVYRCISYSLIEQIRNMSNNTKFVAVANTCKESIDPTFLSLIDTVITLDNGIIHKN